MRFVQIWVLSLLVLNFAGCTSQHFKFITDTGLWAYLQGTWFMGNTMIQWSAFSLIILCSFLVSRILLILLKLRVKHHYEESQHRISVTQLILQTLRKYIYSVMFLLFIRLGLGVLVVSPDIEKIVHSSLVIAIIWLLTIFASRLFRNFMLGWQEKITEQKTNADIAHLFPLFIRTGRLLIYLFGFLLILNRVGYNLYSAIAGLSVGGLALAMAGREAVGHIFAGISLYLDKVVKEGDYLLLDDPVNSWGKVEKVGIRSTTIRTKYNTILIVPNSLMANNPVQNISAAGNKRMFRTKLYVTVDTFSLTLDKTLMEIRYLLNKADYVQDPDVHFTIFGNHGLGIRIQYFVQPFTEYHNTVNQMNIGILQALERNNVKIARSIDSIADSKDS